MYTEEQEKERLADAVTKAIGYTENGGKPKLDNLSAGKTGEMKSIFQFTPDTWKQYSKEITGRDDLPLDNDHETWVVKQKVLKWINEGKTAGQIASMWNAGESKPNAYKENWKGVNKKYGVAYDTPAYAKKVVDYSKQFYDNKISNIDSTGTALSTEKTSTDNSDSIGMILSTIKSAQNNHPQEAPIKNGALVPQTGMMQQLLARKT